MPSKEMKKIANNYMLNLMSDDAIDQAQIVLEEETKEQVEETEVVAKKGKKQAQKVKSNVEKKSSEPRATFIADPYKVQLLKDYAYANGESIKDVFDDMLTEYLDNHFDNKKAISGRKYKK